MTTTLTGMQGRGASHVRKATYAYGVATEVRVRMTRLQVTQTQLADALGLTQAAISRRLRGSVDFDVTELAATAELLGCSITELLPDDSYGEPVREVRARRDLDLLPRLDSNQQPSGYQEAA